MDVNAAVQIGRIELAMNLCSNDNAVQVLIQHQRLNAGRCTCGWDEWGASHARHVLAELRGVLLKGLDT